MSSYEITASNDLISLSYEHLNATIRWNAQVVKGKFLYEEFAVPE